MESILIGIVNENDKYRQYENNGNQILQNIDRNLAELDEKREKYLNRMKMNSERVIVSERSNSHKRQKSVRKQKTNKSITNSTDNNKPQLHLPKIKQNSRETRNIDKQEDQLQKELNEIDNRIKMKKEEDQLNKEISEIEVEVKKRKKNNLIESIQHSRPSMSFISDASEIQSNLKPIVIKSVNQTQVSKNRPIQ